MMFSMCDNFNFDYYIFILKVKQRFAQVIIAMAHHDYLSLEGGNLMIEFIIRQCSLQKEMQVTFPPIISLTVVMFLLFSLILYKKICISTQIHLCVISLIIVCHTFQ